MKPVRSFSVDRWAVKRLSFRSLNSHRQRVRKRRIPLPRQARGRDLDVVVSYRTIEPAPVETAAFSIPSETEGSRSLRLALRLLWVCVIILGLIVFGDWLVRFFREAPFAWPSINGRF